MALDHRARGNFYSYKEKAQLKRKFHDHRVFIVNQSPDIQRADESILQISRYEVLKLLARSILGYSPDCDLSSG